MTRILAFSTISATMMNGFLFASGPYIARDKTRNLRRLDFNQKLKAVCQIVSGRNAQQELSVLFPSAFLFIDDMFQKRSRQEPCITVGYRYQTTLDASGAEEGFKPINFFIITFLDVPKWFVKFLTKGNLNWYQSLPFLFQAFFLSVTCFKIG